MTEKQIFDYLVSKGLTKAGAAGMVGNMIHESGLSSINLENTYNKKFGMTDEQYTKAVDNGTYTNFVHDSAGYGLCQWTFHSRKNKLLNYARSRNVSIGDCAMQLDYLLSELHGYSTVYNTLSTTGSVREASNSVLLQFERPADMSVNAQNRRYETSQGVYNRNADSKPNGGSNQSVRTRSALANVWVEFGTINSNKRTEKISKITIHHMAGNVGAEACARYHLTAGKDNSANYYIGSDGVICGGVDEDRRAWTSGSSWNDQRAITIEVANNTNKEPWTISDKAYKSLIALCADICKRYNITPKFTGNNDGSLTLHQFYQKTACIPTYSELLTCEGWKKLSDIKIGDEVACADLDGLKITFEEVYSKVPIKQQDTYTNHDLTATKDHRMVYFGQYNKTCRIDFYNNLIEEAKTNQVYIPLAGRADFDGLPLSDEMIRFYIAVQADGHYSYEKRKDGSKGYFGIEFHLKKERKIERLKEVLEAIYLDYRESKHSDGTTTIRIYNSDGINIVQDICEKYLSDKNFTWLWLKMSPEQAAFFLEEILFWDGCATAKKYTSRKHINLDIVNAIAAINNVGSRVVGNDVFFRNMPHIVLLDKTTRHNKASCPNKTTVSCVSVKTGAFLMRQNGKTFIVGNCPGTYLVKLHKDGTVERDILSAMGKSSPEVKPSEKDNKKPAANKTPYYVQVGAFSKLSGAKNYAAQISNVPEGFIIFQADGLYKLQVNAEYANKNEAEGRVAELKSSGCSAFVTTQTGESISEVDIFRVRIKVDELNVRSKADIKSKIVTTVRKNEVYTIVDTSGEWGKLKSGVGWISLNYTTRL